MLARTGALLATLFAAVLSPSTALALLIGVEVGGCGMDYASCKADPTPGHRPPPDGTFDPFDGTAVVGSGVEFMLTATNGIPFSVDFSETSEGLDKLKLSVFNTSFIVPLTLSDERGWVFTFPNDVTITDVEVDFGRSLNLLEVFWEPHLIGIGLAETSGIPSRSSAEVNFTITAVPEPSSALLVITGLLGLTHRQRNRTKCADNQDIAVSQTPDEASRVVAQ